MRENTEKTEIKTLEEVTEEALNEEAEMLVASDEVASGVGESGSMEEEDAEEENPYEVKLFKEYEFDDGTGMKKYASLDLSGLFDLTTQDGELFDRMLAKKGHAPANKFIDTTYTKYVAMRATKLPAEFFNKLLIRDMAQITYAIQHFFLFGSL